MIFSTKVKAHNIFKEQILAAAETMTTYQRYSKCNVEIGDKDKNPWFELPDVEKFILDTWARVDDRPVRTHYWVNVYKPGAFQEEHNHMRNDGVETVSSWNYFVDIPANSSEFVAVDFDKELRYSEEGLVVFFPPDMNHYVTKNMSDETRVTLAGNIMLC